jgi:hypothetical protein
MSTRGFIGMRHNGELRLTYNHSDSYPSWLGSKTLQYIQRADVEDDAIAYFQLPTVDESEQPTPEQSVDLKARGYWHSVSTSADWYSHLRDCQGDIERYIRAGYLPTISNTVLTEKDIFMEWGYVIDVDAKELVVYEGQSNGPTKVATYAFDVVKSPHFDPDAAVAVLETQSVD